jgi:hypothetical protein
MAWLPDWREFPQQRFIDLDGVNHFIAKNADAGESHAEIVNR